MKLKNFFIRIIAIMSIIIFIWIDFCMATSKNTLLNQQNELDEKIDQLKDEKDEITANKSEALKSIESLNGQISNCEGEIKKIDTEISQLNSKIAELQKEIDEATVEYNKQSDLLDARLITMYTAGKTSYLEMILSARDFSELISKYHLMSVLTENDTKLLAKIQEQKEKIEKIKKDIEANKASIEKAKIEKEAKSNTLKQSKNEKTSLVNKLSAEEKEIQSQLEQFEADKLAIEEELKKISSQYATVTAPSACGYIFPVAGLTRANIRTKTYPSYKGHTGVDVNINVIGKTIVAVKSGTVITSTALKNSNGSYRSYGEYIVIDHHDGTMTLYAHGLAGSRKVSKGQKVSQGQALMTVGSTGNSTGPHLHFEVRVGGSPVNPFPYLP